MAVVFSWNPSDFEKLVANCASEPVTPYIFKYMPKEGRILEAGCGSGRFVYYLKSLGYDICGIELGHSTVEHLNEKFPHLDITVGDVRQLDFASNSLDGVISLGVIEHVIEGIDGPIDEMYRVLKPGAFALVIVPSFNPIRRAKLFTGLLHLEAAMLGMKRSKFARRIFGKAPLGDRRSGTPLPGVYRWPIAGEFFEYRFTKNQFETAVARAGFRVVESVPTSQVDGLYHEFGRMFVRLAGLEFRLNPAGRALNRLFSKVLFLHNHMHLCVVQKPEASA